MKKEIPISSVSRFRNADRFAAICEGAGHLGSELLRGRGELPPAVRADKLEVIGWQFDVLWCRHHELFAAIRAVHHGVKEVFPGGEARGTVRAFESEWHGEMLSLFHTSRMSLVKAEKLKIP